MRFLYSLIALACVSLSACSEKRDGATPQVVSVAPPVVCTAQGPSKITITGTGFSPAVKDALTSKPAVLMPQVYLVNGGSESELPPDGISLPPGNTAGTQLAAVIPMNLVGPGTAGSPDISYDVRVVNPNGHEDVLVGALLVVPPPDLVSFV